jgi:hypothetical protein
MHSRKIWTVLKNHFAKFKTFAARLVSPSYTRPSFGEKQRIFFIVAVMSITILLHLQNMLLISRKVSLYILYTFSYKAPSITSNAKLHKAPYPPAPIPQLEDSRQMSHSHKGNHSHCHSPPPPAPQNSTAAGWRRGPRTKRRSSRSSLRRLRIPGSSSRRCRARAWIGCCWRRRKGCCFQSHRG